MPSSMRRLAKAWLPPAIAGLLRTIHLGKGITFTGPYSDWQTACGSASGYDAENILERVKQTTLRVKTGEIPFERDSVAFDRVHHSYPVLAGLLRASAENGNQLSLLDFGGSLGSSYRQCRSFLSVLESIRWSIVEQPHYVRCGQSTFADDELRFHFTIADCMREERPNAALVSGVIQFLPRPFDVLTELMDSGVQYIVIDRTPFADMAKDAIAVQHIPPSIFEASYASWIFAEAPFRSRLRERFEILAEFDSAADGRARVGHQEFVYGGMILRRR